MKKITKEVKYEHQGYNIIHQGRSILHQGTPILDVEQYQ